MAALFKVSFLYVRFFPWALSSPMTDDMLCGFLDKYLPIIVAKVDHSGKVETMAIFVPVCWIISWR